MAELGILHTIFFHRFFPSIRPKTRDVLDLTLPVVEDVELETLIDQRTAALVRQLDTSSDMGVRSTGVRGQIAVQFFEKRRRKAWFTKGEEEVCWEQWTLDVTLATPKTESGNGEHHPMSRHELLNFL
jgi:autophagy-related protein 101